MKQGKFDQAELLHRKALKVRRETLGDKHRETLVSVS